VARSFVEAAVRTVADREDRIGNALALRQALAHMLLALCFGVLARRRAGELLEDAMEVMRAHADATGELAQCERRFRLLDEPTCLRHFLAVTLAQRQPLGLAALARTKASGLRLAHACEKHHVFRPRAARGARRTTEHAGRAHAVDERAIGIAVARDHRPPPRIRHDVVRWFGNGCDCAHENPSISVRQ